MCSCADQAVNEDTQQSKDTVQWNPQYTDEWQENEYTATILKPETGEMSYYVDDTENGRFSISLTDITMDDTNSYIELLKADGYSELGADENDASGGVLLLRDNVSLSIAYSVNGIVISIIME